MPTFAAIFRMSILDRWNMDGEIADAQFSQASTLVMGGVEEVPAAALEQQPDEGQWCEKNGNKKSKSFMLVVGSNQICQIAHIKKGPGVEAFVGQEEVGPVNGERHFQAAILCDRAMRATQVAASIGLNLPARNSRVGPGNQVSLKPMLGLWLQGAGYCCSGSWCSSCHGSKEYPESLEEEFKKVLPRCICERLPHPKGAVEGTIKILGVPWANEIEYGPRDVISIIQKGGKLSDLAKTDPKSAFKYFRQFDRLAVELAPTGRVRPFVSWIYGPPGKGKSTTALAVCDITNTYVSWSTQWFDGYTGQPHCIIDDIKPNKEVNLTWLLRLLDALPLRVPIKGSSTSFVSEAVTITSVYSPQDFWQKMCGLLNTDSEAEPSRQLLRRLDIVEKVPLNVDTKEAVLFRIRSAIFSRRQQVSAPAGWNPDRAPVAPVFTVPHYAQFSGQPSTP